MIKVSSILFESIDFPEELVTFSVYDNFLSIEIRSDDSAGIQISEFYAKELLTFLKQHYEHTNATSSDTGE